MTADIEIYEPPAAPAALNRSELNATFKLAKALSETSFAPNVFRNKPFECLAAILTGRELGIGPMESLTQIHVIQGRPTLSAQLMRALVYRHGHSIQVKESTDQTCTVVGTRRDSGDTHEFTFSMEDARAAGLVKKGGGWDNYPRAMLAARATSALCRELFPDCLAGAAYVPEELGGEAQPEDVKFVEVEVLPTDKIVDVRGEAVDETSEPMIVSADSGSLIAATQRAAIFAGCRERQLDPHGAAHEALGHPVESLNELSQDEAATVIGWVRSQPMKQGEPQ
jgi:hypothetical protein